MRFQVLADSEPRPVELAFGDEKIWPSLIVGALLPSLRPGPVFETLWNSRISLLSVGVITAAPLLPPRALKASNPLSPANRKLKCRCSLWSVPIGSLVPASWGSRNAVALLSSPHRRIPLGASGHRRWRITTRAWCRQWTRLRIGRTCGTFSMPLIWGEATAYSAPFYAKTLSVGNHRPLLYQRHHPGALRRVP